MDGVVVASFPLGHHPEQLDALDPRPLLRADALDRSPGVGSSATAFKLSPMRDVPNWKDLYRQLPGELRRYALSIGWDRARLWALDLPIEKMSVDDLDWQLDLPWWRHGGTFFALRPTDVLAAPDSFRVQYERTLTTDLAFPIDIINRHGRWFILDGVHRLLKAKMLGLEKVTVRKVPGKALRLITADVADSRPLRMVKRGNTAAANDRTGF